MTCLAPRALGTPSPRLIGPGLGRIKVQWEAFIAGIAGDGRGGALQEASRAYHTIRPRTPPAGNAQMCQSPRAAPHDSSCRNTRRHPVTAATSARAAAALGGTGEAAAAAVCHLRQVGRQLPRPSRHACWGLGKGVETLGTGLQGFAVAGHGCPLPPLEISSPAAAQAAPSI